MVSIPSTASISPTAAVTVEAWVDPATVSSWRAIAVKEQGTSRLSYGLYAASDVGPAALVYTSAEQNAKSPSSLPLNTWSYVAAVYGSSSLRIYVNGALAAQKAIS